MEKENIITDFLELAQGWRTTADTVDSQFGLDADQGETTVESLLLRQCAAELEEVCEKHTNNTVNAEAEL